MPAIKSADCRFVGIFPDCCIVSPVDGRILYVGGYNGANIDGLRRFFDCVWPKVLRQIPSAKLHVCGHIYRAFAGQRFENVKFLGHKENLEEEYRRGCRSHQSGMDRHRIKDQNG